MVTDHTPPEDVVRAMTFDDWRRAEAVRVCDVREVSELRLVRALLLRRTVTSHWLASVPTRPSTTSPESGVGIAGVSLVMVSEEMIRGALRRA